MSQFNITTTDESGALCTIKFIMTTNEDGAHVELDLFCDETQEDVIDALIPIQKEDAKHLIAFLKSVYGL